MEKSFLKTGIFLLPTMAISNLYFWSVSAGGVSVSISVYRAFVIFMLFSVFLFSTKLKLPQYKIARLFFYLLLFWIVWGVMSLLWTPDLGRGIKHILSLCFSMGVLLCLYFLEIFKKPYIDILLAGWRFSFVVACTVGIWELYTGNHLPSHYFENAEWYVKQSTYAASFFNNPNNFCAYLVLTAPIVLMSLLNGGLVGKGILRVVMNTVYMSYLVLSVYFILISDSRAAFIGFIMEFLVFFVLYFSVGQNILKMMLLVTILGGVVYSLSDDRYHNYGTSMAEQLKTLSSGELGQSGSGRLELFHLGMRMLYESGGLGIGAGGFQQQAKTYLRLSGNADPHNFLMSILSQYGLFIFALFTIWATKVFRELYYFSKSKGIPIEVKVLSIGYFSSFVGYFFVSISNSAWLTTSYTWLYMVTITCLCIYMRKTLQIGKQSKVDTVENKYKNYFSRDKRA